MAIDASLIEADVNEQNSTLTKEWDAASIDPAEIAGLARINETTMVYCHLGKRK